MKLIEFSCLFDEASFKETLQKIFGCSGQLIKRHFSSKDQDRKIKAKETIAVPLDFANHLKINPEYQGPSVKIISETGRYLVLHKPPNVHCHPQSYGDKNTLLNFLCSIGKFIPLMINQESYDRGLLYRLDYETSGVVVLAKDESFFKAMRSDFSQQMKRKFYWAIVEGDFDKEGLWEHHFKSMGPKGGKQKVIDFPEEDTLAGSLSVLKVTSGQGKSLLLINLKSGKRHQIRAQLGHLKFPILGDELYGGKKSQRLFLHALRYEFDEIVEDPEAELFQVFFDLNGALQMSHDMLRRF